MPATPIATLLSEAACYACYAPGSVPQLAGLALLSRIASGGSSPVVPVESLKQTSGPGSTGVGPFADAAGDRSISDTFIASSSYTLTQTRFKWGRFNAGASGQLRCHIYALLGTQAAGLPTGASLGASTNTIDVTTLTPSGYPNGQTPVTFTFAGVPIINGTGYCHVIVAESFAGIAWAAWGINTIGIGLIGQSTSPVTVWSTSLTNYVMEYENWGI